MRFRGDRDAAARVYAARRFALIDGSSGSRNETQVRRRGPRRGPMLLQRLREGRRRPDSHRVLLRDARAARGNERLCRAERLCLGNHESRQVMN